MVSQPNFVRPLVLDMSSEDLWREWTGMTMVYPARSRPVLDKV